MASDVLVQVEDLSKKYCLSLKRSLWYGVQDITSEFGLGSKSKAELRKNEFWALQDISLELRRGGCLGLIGSNGAGKSTLLKLLNGLIKPDRGRISIRGRIGALIELGAGFNPVLTARENIFINGAVLGMGKKEVQQRLDSIVEFAELADFIDSPIQSFSSGMKVRLGFAIAVQMDPDVLIIDEVLAVGDLAFRAKCFNAIRELTSKAAVILVSHQMPEISRSCSSACLLSRGQIISQSEDVSSIIRKYFSFSAPQPKRIIGGNLAKINWIKINGLIDQSLVCLDYNEGILIDIQCEVSTAIATPEFVLTVTNESLQNIMQCSTLFDDYRIDNSTGKLNVTVEIPSLSLNTGIYSLSLGITDAALNGILVRWTDFCSLNVAGRQVAFAPIVPSGIWSHVQT